VTSAVFSALLLIKRLHFLEGHARVIPILLLVLHPFMFAHYAYIWNRVMASCAIIFITLSALAITTDRFNAIKRTCLSGILLSLCVLSYQPAIGAFIVCALFLHANEVIEKRLKLIETVKFVFSIVIAIVIAAIFYELVIKIGRPVWGDQIRVHNMLAFPTTRHELIAHIKGELRLLETILFERTQFLPLLVKGLLFANMACLSINLAKRAKNIFQGLWHVILVVTAFLLFFFTVIFVYPIIPMPRIMPGLIFSWFFVFLFSMKFSGAKIRAFSMYSAIICVVIFAVQFNVMHERLLVKNEIDKEITWQIIRKVQETTGINKESQIIALVGTLSHRQMPYWHKFTDVYEHTLYPDVVQSVYEYDWSKYRLLEFYLPIIDPNEVQWKEANALAETSPVWPAEGSVIKGNGFTTVVLSRPRN
jgi:hypothetical protein